MSEYAISKVYSSDKFALSQIDKLLAQEGIRRDANLDYTCAMYDEDYNIIGTGSCFGNTLRCFAVSSAHQGEGLLNQIISHLISVQYERGNVHLFLYTKVESALFFGDLGFYEIARVDGTLVFMENRRNGFAQYLERLKRETAEAGLAPAEGAAAASAHTMTPGAAVKQGNATTLDTAVACGAKGIAAIVMNANPFTLGHQFLVETAAAACNTLHLFVVSEDASLVPFTIRKRLVKEGTAHIPNVILHDSGPYMISNATFPSYFLKDEAAVITGHARLDIEIFTKIARALGITARFVGEEPASEVTGIYNKIMAEELPKAGIACRVIPRRTVEESLALQGRSASEIRLASSSASGAVISASTVRRCLQKEDWQTLRALVPETTLRYFQSPEAAPVLKKLREAGDVAHY